MASNKVILNKVSTEGGEFIIELIKSGFYDPQKTTAEDWIVQYGMNFYVMYIRYVREYTDEVTAKDYPYLFDRFMVFADRFNLDKEKVLQYLAKYSELFEKLVLEVKKVGESLETAMELSIATLFGQDNKVVTNAIFKALHKVFDYDREARNRKLIEDEKNRRMQKDKADTQTASPTSNAKNPQTASPATNVKNPQTNASYNPFANTRYDPLGNTSANAQTGTATKAPAVAQTGAATNAPAQTGAGTNIPYQVGARSRKSVGIAFLLMLFLGTIGAQSFYLSYKKTGIVQLLLTLFLGWTIYVPVIVMLWSFIIWAAFAIGLKADGEGRYH
ncbi:MAG: TM2 domain-containing protein [Firmicutes bacterium]|nr:TM2 domain-containing protein [Bacillota bacterium]